ncbi:MAG: Holliday junction resolvase RuvX [Gammaproteobacteria bacterium]|nr:Holliday junction resolvase RuvX [Gammaproteobacteria bacterium]
MGTTGRTLLGFDYGRQRIGVAVAQELIGQASPLETLRCVGNKPDWDSIRRLIERWQPDALVVGIPLEMDGGEQEMTQAARRFARQLEGRMGLPVYGADERLSSIAATGMAFEAGRGARRGRMVVDDLAAKIILDTFMAEGHGSGQGLA